MSRKKKQQKEDDFSKQSVEPPSQVRLNGRILRVSELASNFDECEIVLIKESFSRNQFGKVVVLETVVDTRRRSSRDGDPPKTTKIIIH